MTATSLLVQSALLILAAHFAGIWLGCVLRRVLMPRANHEVVAQTSKPLPEAQFNMMPDRAAGQPAPAAVTAVQAGSSPVRQGGPANKDQTERFAQALRGRADEPVNSPPAVGQPEAPAAPVVAPSASFEPIAPRLAKIEPRPQFPAAAGGGAAGVVAGDARASAPNAAVDRDDAGLLAAAAAAASTARVAEPVATAEASTSSAAAGANDLTLIKGLDDGAKGVLGGLGFSTFAQIVGWTAADVKKVDAALGLRGHASRENWIEQAKLLASGVQTHFLRCRPASGPPSLTRPIPDEGSTLKLVSGGGRTDDDVRELDAQVPRDRLQDIVGVNGEIESILNALGVRRFMHIADWGADEIERFNGLLGTHGRIEREDWIAQARKLAGLEPQAAADSGDVAPPAAAETARRDGGTGLEGLRSVRSEAYVPAGRRVAAVDDLKRIRGVGLQIENKLRMMGYTSYEQIANWTLQDVDRVSEQ
ncbi:MAG TPA: hypothetical protein VMX97_10035, partial [Hyphomicrobiaceae bacterium]|nr:hypothetical protein [Hyphomicrobiaceae bacterium]